MKYISFSDIGLMRESNQDRVLVIEKDNLVLGMVCDGIGGSKAGDVASENTIHFFKRAFEELEDYQSIDDLIAWFKLTLSACNLEIYNLSKTDEKYRGMGTTCNAVMITNNRAVGFNVGDSRIYDYRMHKLSQLSHDQTYAYLMYIQNEISKEEVDRHPRRNILINAIGLNDAITCETILIPDGWDRLMLCSDGLHGYVDHIEIQEAFSEDLETTSSKLKALAYNAGGYDNVSLVIFEGVQYE